MSKEEKVKKKRQLSMQQLSYQSDLKRLQRDKNQLVDEQRRLKRERSKIDMYITETEEKLKKNAEKEAYYNTELHRLKKKIIELG